MSKNQQTMMLITSIWGEKQTFRMMPVSQDCPFAEVIYDPETTLLVVIGKTLKPQFQYVPRLDDNGEIMKTNKPKLNGKTYKEQRVVMDMLQEFYLIDKEEQKEFIKNFAINATTYDFEKYLRDINAESNMMRVENQGLVDSQGLPITKN